jgi:hypothetical protein
MISPLFNPAFHARFKGASMLPRKKRYRFATLEFPFGKITVG